MRPMNTPTKVNRLFRINCFISLIFLTKMRRMNCIERNFGYREDKGPVRSCGLKDKGQKTSEVLRWLRCGSKLEATMKDKRPLRYEIIDKGQVNYFGG